MNAALDQIHNQAYQSDALTVFNDFSAPQAPTSAVDDKNLSEDIPGGLSGLYSRLKVSVGGVKDIVSGTGKPGDKVSAESSVAKSSADDSSTKPASDQTVVATDSQQPHHPDLPQEARSANSPKHGDSHSTHDAAPSLSSSKDSKLHSKPASVSSKVSTLSFPPPGKPLAASSNDKEDKSLNQISSALVTQPPMRSPGIPARPLDIAPPHADGTDAPNSSKSFALDNKSPDRTRRLLSADRQAVPEIESISDGPSSRKSSRTETAQDAKTELQNDFASSSLAPFHPDKSTTSVPLSGASPPRSPNERVTFHEPAEVTPISAHTSDAHAKSSKAPLVVNGPRERQGGRTSEARPQGYLMSRDSSTETMSSSPQVNTSDDFHFPRNLRPKKPTMGGRSDGVLSQLRSRLLSKDFWMRDETAKDCFLCGDTFSTFRRKHHCRTYVQNTSYIWTDG